MDLLLFFSLLSLLQLLPNLHASSAYGWIAILPGMLGHMLVYQAMMKLNDKWGRAARLGLTRRAALPHSLLLSQR